MKMQMPRVVGFGLMAMGMVWSGTVMAAAPSYPITKMTDLGGSTYSKSAAWGDIIGAGGGIKNGTLNANFTGWWSQNCTFTVGKNGKLYTPDKPSDTKGEMNFKANSKLIIDGGQVYNRNQRGGASSTSYGQYFADVAGNSELRIINGGLFKSSYLFVRVANNGTGTISIDNGTLNVADGNRKLIVGSNASSLPTLAVTNGTVTASEMQFCENASMVAKATFVDSTLNCKKIYRSKDPASGSFCIMDGCTINSSNAEMMSNLSSIPYQLQGKGLTLNPSVDTEIKGYYTASATSRGSAPIIKQGSTTLRLAGVFDGTRKVNDTDTGITDYQVLGGTLNFTGGTYLPADQLSLTVKNGGTITGAYADLTEAYNSLTVDGTVTFPIAFNANGCTQIKATTLTLATTEKAPYVTLACSGTLTEGVTYCVREGITRQDAAKFKLEGLPDAKLVWRDNNLYVMGNVYVTWQGASGDNWWDTDKWLLDDSTVAFANGYTSVFKTDDAEVVLDANAQSDGVIVSNNVSIIGAEKALTTPYFDVVAGKTATVAATLVNPIVKKGAGELVVNDLAQQEPVEVREGTLKFGWTGTPTANPLPSAGNRIAGVVDLGGATQDFDIGSASISLGSGGELRNGTVNLSFSAHWFVSEGANVTFGKDANVYTPDVVSSAGQLVIQKGRLTIDGGTLYNQCNRGSGYGHYIGADVAERAELCVINGGTFYSKNFFVRVANNGGATGVIAVTNGTVNVADGNQELRVATSGTTGIIECKAGLIVAQAVRIGEGSSAGVAQLTFEDSTVRAQRFYKSNTLGGASFIKFDGLTFEVTGNQATALDDMGMDCQLVGDGLTINNANDTAIAAKLAGTGKLVKQGAGKLKLAADISGEGNLEVQDGAIEIVYNANGFTTRNRTLVIGEAFTKDAPLKLTVSMATDNVTPTPGQAYTLFAGGMTDELLESVKLDSVYYELLHEDGQLKFRLSPQYLTWTGTEGDRLWSSTNNWTGLTRDIGTFDYVIFDGEGELNQMNTANGAELLKIDVRSGTWVTDVEAAAFTNTPLAIAAGATFALTNVADRINLFSMANNANVILGTLDLGGMAQTFTCDSLNQSSGIFRSGAEFRNGTYNINATGDWFMAGGLKGFTIGKGATVILGKDDTGRRGQVNFRDMSLKIDGGEFRALNNRDGNREGAAYLGNGDGDALVEVVNGGKWYMPNLKLHLGTGNDGTGNGTLRVDHGTLDFDNRNAVIGHGQNHSVRAELRLTNSVMKCGGFLLGLNANSNPGQQTVEFVDSELTTTGFVSNKVNAASTVTFNGATIKDVGGDNSTLLADLGVPYTVAEGGLTLEIADCKTAGAKVTLAGTFNGTGPVTLTAKGDSPKTLNVTSMEEVMTFPGAVTVGNGFDFTHGTPDEAHPSVVVFRAKGVITLDNSYRVNDDEGYRFFVLPRGSMHELRYGKSIGTQIYLR